MQQSFRHAVLGMMSGTLTLPAPSEAVVRPADAAPAAAKPEPLGPVPLRWWWLKRLVLLTLLLAASLAALRMAADPHNTRWLVRPMWRLDATRVDDVLAANLESATRPNWPQGLDAIRAARNRLPAIPAPAMTKLTLLTAALLLGAAFLSGCRAAAEVDPDKASTTVGVAR